MPRGTSAGKSIGKPVRQLLFTEAFQHSRSMISNKGLKKEDLSHTSAGPAQNATIERILEEVTAVDRRLEGMDSTISSLVAETKSIRLDIVGFQSRVTGLEQRADQLLIVARSHFPLKTEDYEVRFVADFSKETNNHRKAFLSLRPRLRKLDVKYSLFNPDDLRLFLDDLLAQALDMTPLDQPPGTVYGPTGHFTLT
ncbi:hypothetical protein NDU88_005920 [Pleurodeles waltl]|uniref:Uncharacterized protein n=1 Tax=Pleurodeles waltl TaxID=8319 RepID=A0AAV7NTM9_PLEWA|nr:hypothetical protein NDU88_005920 [Pleurodeles waltl]